MLHTPTVEGVGLIPSQRTKFPQVVWCSGGEKKKLEAQEGESEKVWMPQPQPGALTRAASLSMAQQVENPPAMQETQETQEVESLGQEDPLEKEMAIHFLLARKILKYFQLKKKKSVFFSVFLPGKFHG